MKVNSYYRGRKVSKRVLVGGTKWQRFCARVKKFFQTLFTMGIIFAMVFVAFFVGRHAFPITVVQTAQAASTPVPPVLQRIAMCESRSSQTCTDDLIAHGLCKPSEKGQILTRANNNKTVDVGKYQINEFYYGAVATKQGYNIFTEDGNEAMAQWIYQNKGTGDWSASEHCWK